LHSRNQPLSSQSPSDAHGEEKEEEDGERRRRLASLVEIHGVFDEPNKPTNPDTHSPQVPSTDKVEHVKRFSETQLGALEQFTPFNTVRVNESVLFKSSGVLVTWDSLIPSKRKTLRSSTPIHTSPTDTSAIDREEELNWSNTPTAQKETEGRWVEVKDNSILDLNTTRSEEEEDDERYPNW
jgi:hypothetical protein